MSPSMSQPLYCFGSLCIKGAVWVLEASLQDMGPSPYTPESCEFHYDNNPILQIPLRAPSGIMSS